MKKKWWIYCTLAVFVLLTESCSKKNKESNNTFEISRLKNSYLASYKSVSTAHKDSLSNLVYRVQYFYGIPNATFFIKAKNSWYTARRQEHFLRPFSRMSGAISNPITANYNLVETTGMNASYVDYTLASPNGGIIMDTTNYPVLSQSLILSLHDVSSANKSVGFQVLEFLFWGEDNSTTNSGVRSSQDYIASSTISARRKAYLLNTALALGAEYSSSYYTEAFESQVLKASNDDFLRFYFTGLVDFIEIDFAESALNYPYTTQNINDELSVFSDNTLTELMDMMDAVDLFLFGNDYFEEHTGYFVYDFAQDVAPELAVELLKNYNQARASLKDITQRFDNAMLDPSQRVKIKNTRDSLLALAQNLRSIALEMGVSL